MSWALDEELVRGAFVRGFSPLSFDRCNQHLATRSLHLTAPGAIAFLACRRPSIVTQTFATTLEQLPKELVHPQPDFVEVPGEEVIGALDPAQSLRL